MKLASLKAKFRALKIDENEIKTYSMRMTIADM